MICGHTDRIYDNRILDARENTTFALDGLADYLHSGTMRSAAQILEDLKSRKVTQGAIAEVLGIKQPNAAKLYGPDKRTGKPRALGYDEALKLIETFGLDDTESQAIEMPGPAEIPSEAALRLILTEILRASGDVELPSSTVRPVVQQLRGALELLARNPAIQDNEDAIRAVVDALRVQLREPTTGG